MSWKAQSKHIEDNNDFQENNEDRNLRKKIQQIHIWEFQTISGMNYSRKNNKKMCEFSVDTYT